MLKYSRNSQTVSGRLHDEIVMMDLERGKYFSLNPVATRIWDLLEYPLNMDELCGALMGEYDVSPEQCMNEVKGHLEEMAGLGLIIMKGE